MKTFHHIVRIVFFVSLGACNLPQGVSETREPPSLLPETIALQQPPPTLTVPATSAPQKPSPTMTMPAASAPPLEHHVAIRVVNGIGEFFNRETGENFIPRGMNYVRLGPQTKLDGTATFGHSLFDPGKYDSQRVSSDLGKMHNDGYNVVRVFLSPDTMGATSGGFSQQYIHNIVEFLNYAETSKIYVMFTLDWLPGGIYGEILNSDCCDTFALMNANFLPAAGLKANQVFFQDFVLELIKLGAPTEFIWSYELRNEMFYDMGQPPLAFTSGKVTTTNGRTYDMSSADDKIRMIEENNVFWLDSVRAAILEVDPTALVSVGFFHPQSPNPSRIGDPRFVVSAPALWQSQIDFVDLHAYPGFELNLKQHVENFGVNGMQEKPIVMGEFGGEISRFSSIQEAANEFVNWQVESCTYGFDGWVFWTWDLDEQPDFFNALMQDGAINGVLAPILRSDPCAP